MSNEQTLGHEIAVIGMAGRFPRADDIDAFWQNLCNGVESITFFSDEELLAAGIDPSILDTPNYIKARGVMEQIEYFDAAFFGYNPRDAEVMDPQQRIFLEESWHALESAGYDPERYKGRIGVYAGVGMSGYLLWNLYGNRDRLRMFDAFQVALGNDKDHLTTRVSYKLNLKGPSVNVQTACSTSLVAVHLACQSILNGECDMALAGGISIGIPPKAGYFYLEGGIASPDGHCRAFDARALGTVNGSGVGIVVLKRLADALTDGDTIHAVIKGSAINNDGAVKVGYTAPSVDGQAEVIAEALALADVDPEMVTYIEAHGTGTPLGDPIEIAALTQAFRTDTLAKGFCAIGSVKTNIGHLDTAAGIAGLIKTILALEHKQIPPSLHFERPNSQIDFEDSPFYVNTMLTPWRTGASPRLAGVSSFGMGGTNAHVVLEEPPPIQPSGSSRHWHLLVLSAKTNTALETMTANLATYLKQHQHLDLADLAYTLQVGRRAFSARCILVCRSLEDAFHGLETHDPQRMYTGTQEQKERSLVFMFPGQGTQYVGMTSDLYQSEPTFRKHVDFCSNYLYPYLGRDLRTLLYPGEEERAEAKRHLNQTVVTQVALFVVEYALAQLWMEWGVRPQAMIGHSIGEYVAACLAGVFTLEDALALVAMRGRLMQQLPPGAMLSVPLSEQELQSYLDENICLAAVNGPSLCVLSGPVDTIADMQSELVRRGVDCRRLHTSHAFHSAMMDSVLEQFAQQVEKIPRKPPTIPYISNITGTWITARDATDPRYWSRHLRSTVRFAAGIDVLTQAMARVLLEVGPGRTLSTLARQYPHQVPVQVILTSLRHPQVSRSDEAVLLETLGKLWLVGIQIDWEGVSRYERRKRLLLPTYPFERKRYWIEPGPISLSNAKTNVQSTLGESLTSIVEEEGSTITASSLHTRPQLLNAYIAPGNAVERTLAAIWQEVLGIDRIGIHDDFFELGGHSLMAAQLISRLREAFPVEVPLRGLFEMPTIAQMADLIEGMLIDMIEVLPEDEIQSLI